MHCFWRLYYVSNFIYGGFISIISYRTGAAVASRLFIGFWLFMAVGILVKGPIAPPIRDHNCDALPIGQAGQMACPFGLYSRYAYFGYYHPALGDSGFLSNRRRVSGYCYSRGFYLESAIGTGIAWRAFWYVFWLAWAVVFSRIAFAGFLFWQGREMLGHPASRFCFAWLAGYCW